MRFDELKIELGKGNISGVKELVKRFLEEGLPAKDILQDGLIAGMDIIGAKFKKNEVFIPEVLIAAKAMHEGLKLLEGQLARQGVKPAGLVVIGTVKGDLHDIGKNIVSMMLKGAGFEIVDLGIDVSPEKFIEAAAGRGADILAMSSLLTTSMPFMKETVNLVKKRDLSGKVKTMIGGAPVTKSFADQIGADAFGRDASDAVDAARGLIRDRKNRSLVR